MVGAHNNGTRLRVLARRLERGRFLWPQSAGGSARLTLSSEAPAMLAGGEDLKA